MEEFKDFTEAHTCKETLKAFEKLCIKLGLDNVPHGEFFDQLSYGLSKNWKFKRFLDHLKNKFQDTEKGGATKVSPCLSYLFFIFVNLIYGMCFAHC